MQALPGTFLEQSGEYRWSDGSVSIRDLKRLYGHMIWDAYIENAMHSPYEMCFRTDRQGQPYWLGRSRSPV